MILSEYYNLNMSAIPHIDIPSLTEVVTRAEIGNSLIGTAQRLNEQARAGAQLHAQRVTREMEEREEMVERLKTTALIMVVALTALSFVLPVSSLVILGICMPAPLMGILLYTSTPETSSRHLHRRELEYKKNCYALKHIMTGCLSYNEVFQRLTRAAEALGNFTAGTDFTDRVNNRTGQLRNLIRDLGTFVETPLCMRGEVV